MVMNAAVKLAMNVAVIKKYVFVQIAVVKVAKLVISKAISKMKIQ
jgi:hypothetical protein